MVYYYIGETLFSDITPSVFFVSLPLPVIDYEWNTTSVTRTAKKQI